MSGLGGVLEHEEAVRARRRWPEVATESCESCCVWGHFGVQGRHLGLPVFPHLEMDGGGAELGERVVAGAVAGSGAHSLWVHVHFARWGALWQVVLMTLHLFTGGKLLLGKARVLAHICPAGGCLSGDSDPVSPFPLQSPAGRGVPLPTGCVAPEGPRKCRH